MVCEICGEPAKGRYCGPCEQMQKVEKLAGDDADERARDGDVKTWECTECGATYEDAGWNGCPECGSKRRRSPPEEVTA